MNASRFSSLASSSASKLCRREVSAPPRSQFFFERQQAKRRIGGDTNGIVAVALSLRVGCRPTMSHQIGQRVLLVRLLVDESVTCLSVSLPTASRSSQFSEEPSGSPSWVL